MSMTLSGRITVHGDKPAETATVELKNATGDTVDQVQVDQHGRYVFYLAAGEWSLNAWDAYGHRGGGSATVEDGGQVELNLDLAEPEGGH